MIGSTANLRNANGTSKGDVVLAQVDLPAGSYEISAMGQLRDFGSDQLSANCTITGPAVARQGGIGPAPGFFSTFILQSQATFASTTSVSLVCNAPAGTGTDPSYFAQDTGLQVVSVATAH